jgi:hypothetical protein
MNSRNILLACSLFLLTLSQAVSAQEKPSFKVAIRDTGASAAKKIPTETNRSDETATEKAPEKSTTSPQVTSEGKLRRWFEVQSATISTRYVFADNRNGDTLANQVQHQEEFTGRFKFDAKGNYSINAGFFTGKTGSWNDTGLGRGRGTTNLYLKQLFFSAKPVKGLELQYGGLAMIRGASSAITSYGAIDPVGQRVILRQPKNLFFDEIAVTYGYIGGTDTPNFNKRAHLLKKSNYHQFLVSKQIEGRAVISADYTFQSGVDTMREAVQVKTKELRVIDSLRFETYQRMDVNPDNGFAVGGEKTLFNRLNLGGGYAQIDRNYGNFNDDAFFNGKRVYMTTTYQITPVFSVSTLWNRAIANDFDVTKRTHFHVAFSYNLLKSLQRARLY